MKLRKKKKLFQLFKMNKVDLVMHGHLHESIEYIRKGIRFLNAGGSITGNEEELKINFLNVKNSLNVEIHKIISNTGTVINNLK